MSADTRGLAELPSSTNTTTVAVAKFTGGSDGGWNNVSLHRFSADQKIASSWGKNPVLGIL